MNMNPRHIMKCKVKNEKWKKVLLAGAMLLIGSGVAQAQVKVHGNIFGGGEAAQVTGNDTVLIHGTVHDTIVGDVFGGGEGLSATVTGYTYVSISNSVMKNDVYGGGKDGSVTHNAHVSISGGQIGLEQAGQATVVGGNVYGGGLGRPGGKAVIDYGNVDSTRVDISGTAYIIGSVFGGGNDGHVWSSTNVTMTGGTIGKKLTMAEFITDSLEHASTHIYTGNILAGGRGLGTVNGQYNDTTGRVFGNTHVTVSGGVVRHSVYGGGGLSSVGLYETDASGKITQFVQRNGKDTGKTYVTITGNAVIGPSKADLAGFTQSERDTAFKYLGGNEGWVFGAGCGLAGGSGHVYDKMTFNDSAFVVVSGNAQIIGSVYGGGENGHVLSYTDVDISGGTIGALPLQDAGNNQTVASGIYQGLMFNLKKSEVAEDEYGVGSHVMRGYVYGGGKGTDFIADGPDQGKYSFTAGRVFGNTNVTVRDSLDGSTVVSSPIIYKSVFGGGSLASVGDFDYYKTYPSGTLALGDQIQRIHYNSGGTAKVTISGGTIGSDGLNNGDVVGGGRGLVGNPHGFDTIRNGTDGADQVVRMAYVKTTNVIINDGAHIKNNVYGGALNGHVYGNTLVTVNGGTIGITIPDPSTSGQIVQGGWHSNVYGGGGGTSRYVMANGNRHLSITAGRVYGNTKVEIKGGTVLNNVYGGGPIASVGTYDLRKNQNPMVANTGTTEVFITDGTIGYDGDGNGNVFGSGLGILCHSGEYPDSLSYAGNTTVKIGTSGAATGPLVKGSVYGSGENGHVFQTTDVYMYSGTVCDNIFGAGSGREHFSGHEHNPIGGIVIGNTKVTMTGGLVKHNVYGGGEMASVGTKNFSGTSTKGSGIANIFISGGQVGVENEIQQLASDKGNVFGGGLGEPSPQHAIYANVDSTYVEISSTAYVTSSVFGGGENSHVLGNTNVNIEGGTIGRRLTLAERKTDEKNAHVVVRSGNVYGGGRGSTPYQTNPDKYSLIAGRVYGNTNVTVSGGTVRHNVYGGGALASVGTFETDPTNDTITSWTSGGKATVTIEGGLIGPTLADLLEADPTKIDTAFLYLGNNEGSVYGSSRGLPEPAFSTLAFTKETLVTIKTGAQVSSGVFGGGENGHVYGNTEVAIQGGTIGGIPLHGEEFALNTLALSSPYYHATQIVKLKEEESEIKEDEYGVGRRIFRGAVFAGGRGSDTYNITTTTPPQYGLFEPTAGRVYGNTKVTVSGGTIYNCVYGGGTIASVGKFKYDATATDSIVGVFPGTGKAEVIIQGGQIGTDGNNNGDVYGGGLGVAAAPMDQLTYLAYVGETDVTVSGGSIKSNVYGGSASGHVQTNTKVTVRGGQIGYTYDDNGKTKVHGGWHSNVYGGGGGTNRYDIPNTNKKKLSISAGRVFGDTEVNIENGATVYHNVYGGGAIASVGTYNVVDPNQPYAGYATGHGKAVVNIYGGTIGIDGNNNGMVFGSAKGQIDTINAFADSLSYVAYSEVKIGDPDSTYAPTVKGSVYGGGENGHVYMKAKVDVNKGTIGVAPGDYQTGDPLFAYRGNVYGAGCGTDTMPIPGHLYNPLSGIVWGETEVNINGGYISRNVYGGGAMASVGAYTATPRHYQDTTASGSGDYHLGDTLSWPVQLDYAMGGKAVVNIYGGHIGTAALASDPLASGCVYGSSRGEAGNRYQMAALSNVKEAYVTVDFTTPNSSTFDNSTPNVIIGSVFGAGENGHVYDTTSVTITQGLVAGSVFGAGDGTATYKDWLKDPSDDHLYKTDVHDIIAGKVFGNTSITINGGWILHNVYGGGNMASVGKANYIVYGEDGDIDSTFATGRTHVRIYGGTIGTDGIENGHVFGSSRGLTFDNTNVNPRYNYNRDFFLGYTNQTFVTIGRNAVATPTASSPRIYGSVFGGGQNGHVRLNTEVVINDAEIGVQYDPSAGNTVDEWTYRGNVYGAGRGIDFVPGSTTEYCTSAGSVTRNTHVIVNGGLIHRNVYGGGSLATVGPPPVPKYLAYDPSLTTVDIIGGTIGDAAGIANEYGGSVFGSSRGVATPNGDGMATVKEAVVNIGAKDSNTNALSGTGLVNASVYGGGENGHVNTNATVNIYGGRVGNTDSDAAKKNVYCGNVYGAGSGTDNYLDGTVAKNNNLTGIVKGNTTINLEGGWVMRNMYGGGEMGSVGTIENDTTSAQYKHTTDYALSWPYEFVYKAGTGKATINVTGGRIGITGKDGDANKRKDNGDIYGGGKGIAAPRYEEAHYANVNETEININYNELNVLPSNYKADGYVDADHGCIAGAVYGGGENGHVNTNTHITLTKGLVGHAIYGGGKGKGKYTVGTEEVYSLTAGKVYGDTRIDINATSNTNAYVVRSVFGGGNLGSVGKGNYIGDTYTGNSNNYGETGSLTSTIENSGRTYINVYGGTIGMLDADHPGNVFKDTIPYGSVFGGCRGQVVDTDDITDDLFAFVNNTYVTIGESGNSSSQPILYGSVYGGGQDGHVRWNTDVTVNGGTIGLAKDATGIAAVGSSADEYWNDRGNVYGGGSGVGLYDENTYGTFSPIAGLVLQKTNVTINGGTIHRNVYGGGNLASVGPKPFGTGGDCPSTLTGATVNINTNIGHSGTQYGGHVYGASRGLPNPSSEPVQKFKKFAMVSHTTVNINNGADVANAVFGGGENGQVGVNGATSMDHTAVVNINGGTVQHTVYGAGEGMFGEIGYTWDTISGFIMGNSTVNLLAGTVNNVFGGGRNAVNAGGATVNVGKEDLSNTGTTITGNVYGANNHNGTPMGDINVNIYKTAHTTDNTYPENITMTTQLHDLPTADANFAIKAVYGGGNESSYTPGAFLYHRAAAAHNTTVHVYNCDNTIKEVYGGANAADIGTSSVNADSYVIIEGGRIHNVYGGGKGNNSANISANIYGTANTEIQGGLIDAVYGGGNQMGSILATNLVINDQTSTTSCDILVDSIFGGSNLAPINGDIVTTIACSDRIYDNIYGGANMANITGNVTLNILGSTITNVFGGSKGTTSTPANIDGNVTLNLYGGTITNAFGGSDINGNITGVVTVNVLDTVNNCALDLTNVYGGSHTATLTAGSGVTTSPVVNIVHGTVKGNVFGGSLGETATLTSNPEVNIGYDQTTMSNTSLDNALSHLPTGLTVATLTDSVKGNVYGGGEMANVVGNTTVNVNRGVVGNITYGKKHGNTGTTLDTIIHAPNSGMVFGGGKGRDTDVSSDHIIAKVTGDTRVNIKGGQVLYSVYGGGELASVSDSAYVTVTGGQVGPAPKVGTEGRKTYNIPIGLNGTDGYVFGGGKGVGDDPISSTNPYGAYYQYADVKNTLVTVNIPADADTTVNRIWGSIFGGAEDGHVTDNANVRYVSGMMGTKGTTSYDGNIFGGGRNYSKKNYTAGRVGGNIKVEMSGGQLLGSIFGGGRLALTGINRNGQIQSGSTYGNVKVIVKGGRVGNQKLIESWTASSMGDVYGGGKGSMTGIVGHDPASALLISITKNTEVIVKDSIASDGITVVSSPIIYGSVFGGGEVANVGHYSWTQNPDGSIHNIDLAGEGLAKVTVSGGRIGIDKMRMSYDPDENTDLGHVFGGGEGIVADPHSYANVNTVPFGDISLLNVMATVGRTEVTIDGNAWVKGSVYGGAENGHVLGNASVKVQGGQIGSGEMPTGEAEVKYTEEQFLTADSLAECPHWKYGIKDALGVVHYNPHSLISTDEPSDGHSWFGNVFGGGSGYYPYIVESAGVQTEVWNPMNGWIRGNTYVEISGGHILTSVYGGCEMASVNGDSTVVVMTGGTIGVPRKLGQIGRHPVTCYLFGAGKGDSRAEFYDKTNVNGVRVDVRGGWIYGSVFGGGEDGHVLKDVKLFVKGNTGTNTQAIAGTATKIGTLGYSSVDGNVFGAGRGFAGNVLTAGGVRGNVAVKILGGQMLGSIYGGGRLASVGLDFVPDTNPAYGYLMEDNHGHVTINISGGVIGNEYESVTHHSENTTGGNVFGGGMGRFTLLDGTTNPIWPNLAKVKDVTVTIEGSDAVIMGNVYGGGEYGTVEEDATVNITDGTVWRDVYGGGFGSDKTNISGNLLVYTVSSGTVTAQTESVTPMEMAGRVKGNTEVSISGGWVKKSVYGGGEMASVGTITTATMHGDTHPFNISWPYKFEYKDGTGTATVSVTGGRVGITGKDYMGPWDAIGGTPIGYHDDGTVYNLNDDEIDDQEEDNGDLYGGGKGISAERYTEAKCANVNTSSVTIDITSAADETNYKDLTLKYDCITGAVYGGGENGHVNANATTTLTNGLIGHAIYGGGKGKGKYKAMVLDPSTGNTSEKKIYSVTAGKVYGNTYININGGHVLRSVFGGGNLGSVGIGNYAGGYGDYNTFGYGEVVATAAQWADTTNSGHTYVKILGGTIGMLPIDDGTNPVDPESVFKDNIPYGSVFGGCRGTATPDVTPAEVAHLFESRPDVFLSYVNHTHVKIGDDTHSPRLYGSVYGGAQDGHIRWNSNVVVNNGVIGAEYGVDNVGSNDLTSVYWTDRGNVFGGGSGIGTYKDDGGTEHNSSVAGSVTQKAHVIVNGGTIHRNVYGGGNMATIGPPRDKDANTGVALIDHDCPIDKTCVTVDINANATIGVHDEYGGNVYGASRGKANPDSNPVQQYKYFALCSYTVVNINGANILKNVYGGGENGQVGVAGGDTLCHTTTVNLNSGLIGTSTANAHVFGGGQGVWGETGYTNDTLSGRVMGTATVNINGGEVTGNVFGGGQLGITYGETYANISGGTVHNHVFGGAWGKAGQIHVYGIRMTNMRSGLVKGNVYGGSYNGDDALEPHPEAFANNNTTETVSLVNYSGGTAMKHVFGAGDHGKSYGSTYVLVGLNAIMNAPPHTATTGSTDPYNQAYYANHGDLIINYDVWAGADFGESNTGTFGTNSITGRSDVYVDGYGYDTENTVSQGDDRFMLLYRSIFGCGTLNDGGRQGKQIMIRNYGYAIDNMGTTDPEHYIDATRRLVSVQYADSLIIESSHIRLQGRGIVNQNIATEEYAIYNIFDRVRVINGSSLFVDKPVNNIGNLYSNRSSNLANHAYPTTPVYTEVNYDGLDATDNKIRINHGGYLTVSITSTDSHGVTTTLYGALRGFFHLMTDGVYNAFAYARPKQSNEAGNIISNSQLSHAYNEDGGFVSYRPEVNIYDAIGTLIEEGGSIQMRYENHTPDQRGDIYFRVWRFSEQAASVLEVVLHAISQPNNPNGFTYYTGTLTLPPRVNDNSIYRVKSNNGVAQINYGSEIALVNAGYQEEGSNWMYYDNSSSSFVMHQSENASALEEGQDFMALHPNNVFGLVAIPTGGLMATPSQDNQTLLICNESNSGVVDNVWHNTLTTAAPQIKFVLTHNNHITGNYSWDPIAITMEQVDGENVTDVVDVYVRIVTTTSIDQPNEVNTYAMMNHGGGTGDNYDVYRAKILLPAYQLIAGADTSAWTLKSVEWLPNDTVSALNGDVFNPNTLVAGEPYDYCSPSPDSLTRNFVGMTVRPTANVDNVVGWWNDYTQVAEVDLGEKKMVNGVNPIPSGGIYLGSTRGENPISFEFDLHYDSKQNVGLAGNAEMGTVKVTMHFTNYETAEGKDVEFYVQVSRRGKGKGFYIDGVNGQFIYSGRYPDAAQPSFAGIMYFADDYEPVDSIYIVNKVTVNPPVHLDWSTPYDEIRFFRYNGGHPLHRDEPGHNDKFFSDYLDTYLHPNTALLVRTNPAYKGLLVDVMSTMNIRSASVDGAYTLPECVGQPRTPSNNLINPTFTQLEDHVISDAPMFQIRQDATLTIDGANDHISILRNNYNKSSNGGAANLETGATLMMNQQAYIDNNYVQDGALEEHHGGGAYLEGTATLVVSDDVMINTNKHVSADRTDPDIIPENVYLNDYVTMISVGTGDGSDSFGALNTTSRIGVTKTAWEGLEYMPVVYTEYRPHGDNLITDSHYHDGQIVFDQDMHYGLYPYPMRKANDDPFYQHKLYWVKTWTDVVTSQPDDFEADNINTPEKLAWAISIANGLNTITSANPQQGFIVTADIDMGRYIWEPIGTFAAPYYGNFEGNGHLVSGIHSPFSMDSKGMFGYTTTGAEISNLQAEVNFDQGDVTYLGGLVGSMGNGTLSNCSSSGYLSTDKDGAYIGGLVGNSSNADVLIHSCYAIDTLCSTNASAKIGGLVGVNEGDLLNAYSRPTIGTDNAAAVGGLVGDNTGIVENCYAEIGDLTIPAFAVKNESPSSGRGVIQHCYTNSIGNAYVTNPVTGSTLTAHGTYGLVKERKEIGYMYDDNAITLANVGYNAYVPENVSYIDHHTIVWNGMLSALNQWVRTMNTSGSTYYDANQPFTSWFRPTTKSINDDLPVLGFPKDNAMATLDANPVNLRYSAAAFDGNHASVSGHNGLDQLLGLYREETASIFLYDNATGVAEVPGEHVKVFVNEDATLLQGANPADFTNTTVGITFDNSSRSAAGYYWGNSVTLEYDWHFLGTPLSNAQIGITYNDEPSALYSAINLTEMEDSYFPNGLQPIGQQPRWDLYTYYEPEYHWINLKRRGDNHYHVDRPYHRIDYRSWQDSLGMLQNETIYVPGKGYMMAIENDSYMSQTGTLNKGPVKLIVSHQEPAYASYAVGCNLLGNPYQAYLDLNAFAAANTNAEATVNKFYAYDADLGVYAPYIEGASVNPCIPSQYIHPHQGFFALYEPTDGNSELSEVTFTPDMATTQNEDNSYYRQDKVNYPVVNIFAENEGGSRDLAIVELMRPELGGVGKTMNFNSSSFKLYTRLEGENFGLLFTPKETKRIPLFFKTDADGKYSLKWNTFNGNFHSLILVDNITGQNYDMLTHDHYDFEALATDFAARFYIVFSVTAVDEYTVEGEDDEFAFFDGNDWVVEGEGELQLIDVTGRVIHSETMHGSLNRVHFQDLATGVYVFHLVKDGEITKVQKIVIRK